MKKINPFGVITGLAIAAIIVTSIVYTSTIKSIGEESAENFIGMVKEKHKTDSLQNLLDKEQKARQYYFTDYYLVKIDGCVKDFNIENKSTYRLFRDNLGHVTKVLDIEMRGSCACYPSGYRLDIVARSNPADAPFNN